VRDTTREGGGLLKRAATENLKLLKQLVNCQKRKN